MGLFAVSRGEEESWSDDGCFDCSSGGANAATLDRHAVDSTRAVVILVMVLVVSGSLKRLEEIFFCFWDSRKSTTLTALIEVSRYHACFTQLPLMPLPAGGSCVGSQLNDKGVA